MTGCPGTHVSIAAAHPTAQLASRRRLVSGCFRLGGAAANLFNKGECGSEVRAMAGDRVRELEDRITRLEEELRQVRAELARNKAPEKSWLEATAGSRAGSKAYETIVREMENNRRAERRAAIRAAEEAERKAKQRRQPRTGKQSG
jgi:hypothetical protein